MQINKRSTSHKKWTFIFYRFVQTMILPMCFMSLMLNHQQALANPAVELSDNKNTVQLNGEPICDAKVSRHSVSLTDNTTTNDAIITTTTNNKGEFSFDSSLNETDSNDLHYYTATEGRFCNGRASLPKEIELATIVLNEQPGPVTINAASTVASAVALAQFIQQDGSIQGKKIGISNSFIMIGNMIDLTHGTPKKLLKNPDNRNKQPSTDTIKNFNSLTYLIIGCAKEYISCSDLLYLMDNGMGFAPKTTWQGIASMTTNPSKHATALFVLLTQVAPQIGTKPIQQSAPTAWTLALLFQGDGKQFNGPGNMVIDHLGRLWIANNTNYSTNKTKICPSTALFTLNPYLTNTLGEIDQTVITTTGGGVNGPGFGITMTPNKEIWLANYGFSGKLCAETPTSDSLSQFRMEPNADPRRVAQALSPSSGWTADDNISWPQGMASSPRSNVWVASCGNNTIIKYPANATDETQIEKYHFQQHTLDHPFDIAINSEDTILVTGNQSNNAIVMSTTGEIQSQYRPPLPSYPLGAAVDSLDHFWIAHSMVIPIPCGDSDANINHDVVKIKDSFITRISNRSWNDESFHGGGLSIPWGIAADGNDHVWVANFSNQRLSHFCGSQEDTCPDNKKLGDPISPSDTTPLSRDIGGYQFDGLQRNTGVQIDQSGNVWLTNNWKTIPDQIDPYGNGMVVFLGIAKPVDH